MLGCEVLCVLAFARFVRHF